MLYVALAAVAALALSSVVWAGIVRSVVRQAARERELLVNQLCHLSGKTWQPAPSEWRSPVPVAPDRDLVIPSSWPTDDE